MEGKQITAQRPIPSPCPYACASVEGLSRVQLDSVGTE